MNTKRKGNDFERKIMSELSEDGYVCLRSAASLGQFDVVAIHPEKKLIQLIQAKSYKASKPERKRYYDENHKFSGIYMVGFRFIDNTDKIRLELPKEEGSILKNALEEAKTDAKNNV